MKFQFNDGGRVAAGYKGSAGDCVVRSVAIVTGLPYQEIYDQVNKLSGRERRGKRKRGSSNARTEVYKSTIKWLMESLAWQWTPTMQIGSGCTDNHGSQVVMQFDMPDPTPVEQSCDVDVREK
jgi:hypothetical protein